MTTFGEVVAVIINLASEWLSIFDSWARSSTILLPILLSVVAAVIFWLAFSYFPESKRRKKLRPIVDFDLFNIYKQLFSMFDLIMRDSVNSPSDYQEKIRAGRLSQNDIQLGLQNKCLNESYLFDPKVKDALYIIGEDVLRISLAIDELIDKVISFHTYATAEEIVLLEEIREQVRKYHFSESSIKQPAGFSCNGQIYYPVDPTISYRKKNFHEMYQLFCKLQEIVLNHRHLSRDKFIYKMQWLYHSGQYDLCIKFIRANGHRFKDDTPLHKNYLAMSEYRKGRLRVFYSIIKDNYKTRPFGSSLTSSRRMLANFINDSKFLEILGEFHSPDEIEALKNSIAVDRAYKEEFENRNRQLGEYFEYKAANPNKA